MITVDISPEDKQYDHLAAPAIPSEQAELLRESAHNGWLATQNPNGLSRSLYIERGPLPSATSEDNFQGHPGLASYGTLNDFALGDETDKQTREQLIDNLVRDAVEYPNVYGYTSDMPTEEIRAEARSENSEFINGLTEQEINAWRKEVREKVLPGNDNWVRVAEVIMDQTGINSLKDMTDEQVKKLLELSDTMRNMEREDTPKLLFELITPEIRELMLTVHNGWRENFHGIEELRLGDPSKTYDNNSQTKRLKEVFENPEEYVGGQPRITYKELSNLIIDIRKKTETNTDITSAQTFQLMADLILYLDNLPSYFDQVSRVKTDLMYALKADVNPSIIQGMMDILVPEDHDSVE